MSMLALIITVNSDHSGSTWTVVALAVVTVIALLAIGLGMRLYDRRQRRS